MEEVADEEALEAVEVEQRLPSGSAPSPVEPSAAAGPSPAGKEPSLQPLSPVEEPSVAAEPPSPSPPADRGAQTEARAASSRKCDRGMPKGAQDTSPLGGIEESPTLVAYDIGTPRGLATHKAGWPAAGPPHRERDSRRGAAHRLGHGPGPLGAADRTLPSQACTSAAQLLAGVTGLLTKIYLNYLLLTTSGTILTIYCYDFKVGC